MTGPALLAPGTAGGDPRVLFNRNGVAQETAASFPQLAPAPPRGAAAPGAPLGPGPSSSVAAPPPERATWPACAVAGRHLACMDLQGSIRRSPVAGGEGKEVAFGRRGASLAAAPLPDDHSVIAFLGDRKTSEGVVTQAFAAINDSAAVPLSAEGAGATFVTLVPWRDGALAVYIDARAALTPVHARPVRRGADGRPELGPDAVIFVGGGAESRMGGAVAVSASGAAWALVPTSHGVSGFGMAAIQIHDPPRDDEPVVWSMYPNGLSPAPIAATVGVTPAWVARARPASKEPGSRAVLELGRLKDDGTFEAPCVAAQAGSFSHVTIEAGRDGTIWLAYATSEGTFLVQSGGAKTQR